MLFPFADFHADGKEKLICVLLRRSAAILFLGPIRKLYTTGHGGQ
jgi:hypothetical protein